MRYILLIPPVILSIIVFGLYSSLSQIEVIQTGIMLSDMEQLGEWMNEKYMFSWIFIAINKERVGFKTGGSEILFVIEPHTGKILRIEDSINNSELNISIDIERFNEIIQLLKADHLHEATFLFIQESHFEPSYAKFDILKQFI
jgi:hypothetical protein